MKHLLIGLLFALAACTSAVPATDAPGATPVPDAAATCAAQGGTIRPVCRRQLPACVINYADAGKTCSNDSDCAGKCVREAGEPTDPTATVTGQCQANSDPCGCRTEVDGGKARTICVD